jgi:hypothetical protein
MANKALVQSIIAPPVKVVDLMHGNKSDKRIRKHSIGGGFSHQIASNSGGKKNFIQVQDFDETLDTQMIKEYLMPYLKDLYKDLSLRSIAPNAIKEQKVDKVTFIQYCNLPGIMSDRVLKIFDGESEGIVQETSFVKELTRIFVSDFETRMRLTFSM